MNAMSGSKKLMWHLKSLNFYNAESISISPELFVRLCRSLCDLWKKQLRCLTSITVGVGGVCGVDLLLSSSFSDYDDSDDAAAAAADNNELQSLCW